MPYICSDCGRGFGSLIDLDHHRIDMHSTGRKSDHRRLPARERPKQRGDIPCGICEMTFTDERSAMQHRYAKHDVRL